MITSVGLSIGDKLTVFTDLIGAFEVFTGGFGEFIVIDEIVAGIIGRVDIDHLDLAQVGFLQEFEGVEVIAFDEEVFGGVEVDALVSRGSQRLGDGGVGGDGGGALSGPVESVALAGSVDDMVAQFLAQLVKIHGELQAAGVVVGFGDAVGEEVADFGDMVLRQVERVHFGLIHIFLTAL